MSAPETNPAPRSFFRRFFTGDLLLTPRSSARSMLLILPVPPALIDVLLAASIGLSLLILLVIIYVREPPRSSPAFPRSAAGHHACFVSASTSPRPASSCSMATPGNIIDAFGNFVVRGNYVVGAVVFLILVVINFIVITKGAGRIAEVAARFTLDAMPGKQMAIDAELNAGIIDEAGGNRRRMKIQKEADFYGAMDGASKFVRGDAIAGIHHHADQRRRRHSPSASCKRAWTSPRRCKNSRCSRLATASSRRFRR